QGVAVRLLGEYLRVNRVRYSEIDGDEFVVIRSFEVDVTTFIDRGPISTFGEALREAHERGDTIVVNDVAADSRFSDAERARLLASEIAAFVGVMLRKEGRWVAVFAVHNARPRIWTRDEIALIEETGARMWEAAERARTEDALRANEVRLAFLLSLDDALRSLSNPSDVQGTAARLLREHLQVNPSRSP